MTRPWSSTSAHTDPLASTCKALDDAGILGNKASSWATPSGLVSVTYTSTGVVVDAVRLSARRTCASGSLT